MYPANLTNSFFVPKVNAAKRQAPSSYIFQSLPVEVQRKSEPHFFPLTTQFLPTEPSDPKGCEM